MLKLKRPAKIEVPKEEPKQKKETKKSSRLPRDTYPEEFDPVQIIIDEYGKLNFSVRRQGDLGLPRLDIRHFQTTDFYTGFTQKGINIPLEMLPGLIETLLFIHEQASGKKLYEGLGEE